MKLHINENACKGCGLCASVCPKNIIAISNEKLNAKGYHVARLTDEEQCVQCAMCATMCPDIAITIE